MKPANWTGGSLQVTENYREMQRVQHEVAYFAPEIGFSRLFPQTFELGGAQSCPFANQPCTRTLKQHIPDFPSEPDQMPEGHGSRMFEYRPVGTGQILM